MISATSTYTGNLWLEPVGNLIGLSVDKVNLLVCQMTSIFFGLFMRYVLSAQSVHPKVRLHFELWVGLAIVYFCVGYQIVYVLGLAAFCYSILLVKPPHYHVITLVVAMGTLSWFHLYRQVFDYGSYTLDVTGSLMIIVQKVSSLAFSSKDGLAEKAKQSLKESHRDLALCRDPTLLEYCSYVFNFESILVGPSTFFVNYMAFIDPANRLGANKGADPRASRTPSFPLAIFLRRFGVCVLSGAVYQLLGGTITAVRMTTNEFVEWPFYYKNLYLIAFYLLFISKYYTAWKLSECVNLASGLAFSGYDKNNVETWDLTTMLDTSQVVYSTRFNLAVNGWNITTARF